MAIEFTFSGLSFKESALAESAQEGSSVGRTRRFRCNTSNAAAAAVAYRDWLIDQGTDPGDYDITADEISANYSVVSSNFRFRKTTQVSFSTSGGSTHLNQSYLTRSRRAAPGHTAPDYEGAIGVDGQTVNGIDVTVPAFNFAIRKRFAYVDDDYLATIANLTGHVNGSGWKNFAGGEVLFLGADGGEDDQNYVDITYQFAVRGNQTGLSFGPVTGVSKFGWDYVWVRHAEKIVGDLVLMVPAAVYVEKVYPSGNFSALGL